MERVNASVITIGSEILFGHILDTNSQFICDLLDGLGIHVVLKASVGDIRENILELLAYASSRSDLILLTGGLGPTNDDITKKCLADFFNSPIHLNKRALDEVKSYFEKRQMPFTELNQKQAELPELAQHITNDMGTAPGMWIEKNRQIYISMPGVPHEMHHMLNTRVVPKIREKYHTPVIQHKLIMTAGIGESWLADKIATWEKKLPAHISLAYLPGYGQVKLKLTGTGDEPEKLQIEIHEKVKELSKIIPEYIYGEDGLTLEGRIGQMLREKNETLSTAESCTGGYLSHLITTIPGCSDYYRGGVIAYHNSIKLSQLGVSENILNSQGAVSEETVREMAAGCLNRFQTHYSIATSGIAGPLGGTPVKPVGTVWIAVADRKGTVTRKYTIPKDRINNIKYSAVGALTLFWQRISQNK